MIDDVGDAWKRILDRLRIVVAGEFEILREIGSGGMAAVYLAREVTLNRQVAIKVMSPALLTGEGVIERFKQEARTIATLDHRNIITIYAVRGSEDLHFFVMKFVKGRSLEHIIRTAGPLPIELVRGLLYMIGDALGHAHQRGVIHGDVKPANILADGDGNAIVTDFGIAKVVQTEGQAHSADIFGTPAYMSPEQCYTQPASAASDQYSLGVVAYEMVTGRPPFSGSAFVVMEAHTKLPPPPMRDLRRDCPPELEAAIMRMLAKDPKERWPSLHQALSELGGASLHERHPVRLTLAKLGIPEPEERFKHDSAFESYVSSLSILAPPDCVEAGDSLTLRALARNGAGDTMPRVAIRWASHARDIAGVNETTGTVFARSPGIVSITARFEKLTSSVPLKVVPRRVAAVSVSIPPRPIHVGDRVQLVTRLEDKTQKELKRRVAWETSESTIASISADGVMRAIAPGVVSAFAEAEGIRGSVEILISPARVAEVRPTMAPGSPANAEALIGTVTPGEGLVAAGSPATRPRIARERRRHRRRDTVLAGAVVFVAALAFAVQTQGKSDTSSSESRATDSSRSSSVAGGSVLGDSIVRDPAVAPVARTRDSDTAPPGVVAHLVAAKTAAANAVASVDILSLPVDLLPGGRQVLVAEVRDSLDNILSIPVEWKTNNKRIATVDSAGVVRAVSAGAAVIYASAGKATSNILIRVRPAPVTALSGTAQAARPETASSKSGREPLVRDTPTTGASR